MNFKFSARKTSHCNAFGNQVKTFSICKLNLHYASSDLYYLLKHVSKIIPKWLTRDLIPVVSVLEKSY